MTIQQASTRQLLQDFEFERLFVEELGWDRHMSQLNIQVSSESFTLRAIAEKRGLVAFLATSDDGTLPSYSVRREIERRVAKSVHEHVIVYVDRDRTIQVWQWVKRDRDRRAACREHVYRTGQTGEALLQRLQAIAFQLDEEDRITIVEVAKRARAAFDVERVTKRFYERFKKEHEAFLEFIDGLTTQADIEWYGSVMLNRLMFVYFIQKKGFLDGNPNYLRDRLELTKAEAGPDQFHSFYRHFLLRLFHEGLGSSERSADLDHLLGKVPYLNGGLFDVHELEREHQDITIGDEAFERLFDFFEAYQWHLDDRPLHKDNEVNPDVLGYIFEKYINQKQMGAYYTREDVTGYITANTVLPVLLERVRASCPSFEFESFGVLVAEHPDRYIPAELAHGTDIDLPEALPAETDLDSLAPAEFGLIRETWREVIERRNRHEALRKELQAARSFTPDDVLCHVLDLQQLTLDVLIACESPEVIRAFYGALTRLSVLDPTCGSGAFLFAALNLLEPLYEAVLERMEAFLVDAQGGPESRFFQEALDEVGEHASRQFFVLKSIIVNNLYGVDIMEEAVEICKLRLFLRLVSQVDRSEHLEPLPDIDFNVRAGNTLVGFAHLKEVERAVLGGDQVRLDVGDAMTSITSQASAAEKAFEAFHEAQLGDHASSRTEKSKLGEQLHELRTVLDSYLASEYGIEAADSARFDEWHTGHQPFHWFTEYYGIMRDRGFDCIVGNPPYLEARKLAGVYRPVELETLECRDIYAWVVERCYELISDKGRIGLIVPVSVSSSGNFKPLRNVLRRAGGWLWLSHYANRPGQLFAGAQNRLTILLASPSREDVRVFTTKYHRWDARRGERAALFGQLRYVELGDLAFGFHGLLPKVGSRDAASVLRKIRSKKTAEDHLLRASEHPIYWVRVPGYFCQFYLAPPMARPEAGGDERVRGEVLSIYATSPRIRRLLHAILNSSTYYQFYVSYSDGRHINPSDVKDFPLDLDAMSDEHQERLIELSEELEIAAKENTNMWRKSGLLIDSLDSRPLKPLLDRIDDVLAEHYGFTANELEYLKTYDLKYRVGIGEDEPIDPASD